MLDRDQLAGLDRHEVGVVFLRLAAVDREPAGLDHHLAVGLETVAGGDADTSRHHELRRRVEHREEALDDHVIELGLGLGQALGRKQGRDDCKVVGDLGVVEDALVRLDEALADRLLRMRRERMQRPRQVFARDHLHRLLDHRHIVFGQVLAVGSRVGQHLVLFVQRLGDRQGGLGREAEARIGFALQGRQVVQARRALRARLGFFGDARALAAHRLRDGLRIGFGPDPVGAPLGVIGVLLPLRIEPLAVVNPGLGGEARLDFPVVARDVLADLLFALDDDRQRGRLHPAHRRQEEATVARVEGRHRTRAVDADEPVGLAAAARRVRQARELLVAAQLLEAVADRLRRHALQPQALDRLVDRRLAGRRVLHDQAKDQLAFPARVASVDQCRHVLALDELDDRVQARLGLLDRRQVEVRRDHRQVRKAPLAALHVVLLGRLDLHQVADRRGDNVTIVLEVFRMFLELAGGRRQRPHDVLRHRGLLSNDECLGHGSFNVRKLRRTSHQYNPGFSRAHTRTRARPQIQCTQTSR